MFDGVFFHFSIFLFLILRRKKISSVVIISFSSYNSINFVYSIEVFSVIVRVYGLFHFKLNLKIKNHSDFFQPSRFSPATT